MGNILDMSEYQPCSSIDWNTFSKNVDVLFFRIQYGSSHPDKEYKNHVDCAKKFNIPFHSYAFPHFVSVNDARVEASDAVSRQDSASQSICIDIEPEYDSKGNSVGITKLTQQVRIDGIKAYVDELRKQGVKKVGAYIDQRVYETWGINSILNLFDYIWIPAYGANNGQVTTKPKYPCDLHQFSDKGKVAGYNGDVDLNTLNGSKPLEYFTGKGAVTVQIVPNSDYVGKTLTSKVDGLWYYNTPQWDKCDGTSNKGDSFVITEELIVNGGRMLLCHDGKYRTADYHYVDVNPKPLEWDYQVLVDNVTLKDAQDIVILINSKYPNAKVNGIAK